MSASAEPVFERPEPTALSDDALEAVANLLLDLAEAGESEEAAS